ncbi:hypothetical protein K458DRAFT_476339 [Lentithecium fluviatile CBS 122367]|uniref:S-adenosyl-L-methionine-dependent methyltransferase n=1 Tax=Lentithecium fluviatile CBS 122367 TaxID=1168545 RepID=A0A6G1JAL8_9PLEO|nr:hypothetical protein K458DRAFT_476339 [Lentithecium fluviatile CBS 122367]
MTAPFMPKQAVAFDGALLKELQRDVSDAIARDLLKDLPPLTSFSVIHDNGCGYGAVTMAVMESDPPRGIRINATEINPTFLAQLQAKLAENPEWPNDVAAPSHIHRTLKPGGTGVIAGWQDMPWHIALENAHHKTRGADESMAPFLSKGCYKKEKLMQVTTDAGWKDVQFVEKAAWLNLGRDLTCWARLAWIFLATHLGGWQQRDEDKWDEAIDGIVQELEQCEWHKVEDGVHKIRMVAVVAKGLK